MNTVINEKLTVSEKLCRKYKIPYIQEIVNRSFIYDDELNDIVQAELALYDGINEEVRMSVYSFVMETIIIKKYLQEMAVTDIVINK